MTARRTAALGAAGLATAALLALTGCDSENQDEARTEKETASAYVEALNARDPDALAKLGRPGDQGAQQGARDLVNREGGRGIQVEDVAVNHEFGPDFADVAIWGTDSKGRTYRHRLTLERTGKTWYVPLGSAPGTPKPSSATTRS
ncbi:hypothetical protein WEB32_13960 [Streptomyces netropsis]|uniref:Lipoprotein n=1 Tax=Streptomyces netropsis TaxID=55404 RepID=A0A7W7PEH3_STRNE|nr:hypothetical protein [Streptomyces netropsis]MBB4887059.1 hypothetical protein [Streptomyces netropsis]GGR25138.1 hypothetical protein GCM10010219_32580 [Streptomyces netropsis]